MGKLEIGVQSAIWYDESKPEESIRFIKECGFDAVDYNINNLFDETFHVEQLSSFFDQSLEELFAYFTPLKNAAKDNDVSISQLHGAFPMYFPGEDTRNEYLIEVTEKMMAVCQYLDCKAIVIHPWTGPDLQKEEEQNINLNMYRRLIPAAKKYGITVCLENMFKHYDLDCYEGGCSTADEACWYIDTLNEEAGDEIFGFCFDVGHAVLTGTNIYQYITKLGKRLTLLHIHDNDGTSDSHMLPFTQTDRTGCRLRIDWEKFIRGLKEIGFEGAISFETWRGTYLLPKSLLKDAFVFISAIGRYFRERIEE